MDLRGDSRWRGWGNTVPQGGVLGATKPTHCLHQHRAPIQTVATLWAAREQTEAELASNPEDPRLLIALAQAHTGLGELQSAYRSAGRALELMPRSRDDLAGVWYQEGAIIGVFAPAGDVAAVVEQLDAFLAVASNWSIQGLLPDPRLNPVRDWILTVNERPLSADAVEEL